MTRKLAAALVLIVALIVFAVFGQDVYLPAASWIWSYILAPVGDALVQFFAWLGF